VDDDIWRDDDDAVVILAAADIVEVVENEFVNVGISNN
jgi:hypothetical protein